MGRLLGNQKHRFYPLHLACYTLSPEITKQLCELGAKPDLKETSHGYTAFLCMFNSRERMDLVGYKDLRHISSEGTKKRKGKRKVKKEDGEGTVRNGAKPDLKTSHGYTAFLCLFNSRKRVDLVGYKDLRHISSEGTNKKKGKRKVKRERGV
jgi:hypothetical protein